MKTDILLQANVQEALNFEPSLTPAQIGVTVNDGVVTLTGEVDQFSKKTQAEKIVRRIKGVRAVVEKIQVELNKSDFKSDSDLAHELIKALRWNYSVPDDKIKVTVEDGYVTLDGSVPWDYQRQLARKEVARVIGVKGIHNNLTLQSASKDSLEKDAIENAIARHWSLEADDIYVRVKDNTVTLTGEVQSLYQKDEAERIAWQAPGVQSVNNFLTVEKQFVKY
ncbi:MAG: BON domain-containing protein [Flavobacterium sp.]|nr:MAG: BON domain-containing protein [Flavobacterium sp.]